MGLSIKINQMITAVNTLMGVIDGKLRNKADKTEVYTRSQLDDPLKTLGANAATASKLKLSRRISLGGEATGTVEFDGSGHVTLVVTVPGLNDKADTVNAVTPAQMEARFEQYTGLAPEFLDTFEEFAAAIGNDPNFAGTIFKELSKKANSAEVYSSAQSDGLFLTKKATAANSQLFNGQAADHYATAASVSEQEAAIGDAFTRLADAFNTGADLINGTAQRKTE